MGAMREGSHSRRHQEADQELAQIFRVFLSKGEDLMLEKLIEAATPAVYNVAYGITKDANLSKDVTQEVFSGFCAHYHELRKPDKIGQWFRKVAHRTAWKRRQKSEKSLGTILDPKDLEMLWVTTTTPLDLVSEFEFLEKLERCIAGLPTLQRKCFRAHFQDVEGERAAELLGISLTAYYSNVSRAMAKLRRELKDYL